jgi:hypothetical protein
MHKYHHNCEGDDAKTDEGKVSKMHKLINKENREQEYIAAVDYVIVVLAKKVETQLTCAKV